MHLNAAEIKKLSLEDLRVRWSGAWGRPPPARVGRTMLEKSLAFKIQNNLSPAQHARLDHLIRQYKRNPGSFDERCSALKPGTRLIRKWKGKQHSVLVKAEGFEYQDRLYTSLSQIANDITGTRWNGHLFFGINK